VPEGDTLHRVAGRLRPALEGAQVVRFSAARLRGRRPGRGVRVEGVEAKGKHLLIHFDDGLTLRTHLRMTGSWHLYRTGERWRESPGKARAVIEVDNGWVAVCFAAPVVETYDRGGPMPAPLARLGPDLCEPDADLDAVVARWRSFATAEDEVGVLLLDQRIAAGIGNVYRSEALFACRLHPSTVAADLDDTAVHQLYDVASRQLRANLTTDRRRTAGDGLAVYGRPGRPCLRCGTPVRTRRQGEQSRSVYWCPACQPAPP
jgi:endonuclease-8